MLLKLQLLMNQSKRPCDFERQIPRKAKSNTVQQDFSDEKSIWHNHCYLPEKCFQVVR